MTAIPINYILIDFENVQPKNLELLAKYPFKVMVFVGSSQKKLPIEFAVAMQQLGNNAQYIEISGNGKNALDFHIAYYIGELAAQEPKAYFHIISKDTGFDPLVKHLRSRKILIQREKDLASIPLLRMSPSAPLHEKIASIIEKLEANHAQSRPRKENTLANAINSWFMKQLDKEELDSLIKSLKKKKYITITDGNVSYSLPVSLPSCNNN